MEKTDEIQFYLEKAFSLLNNCIIDFTVISKIVSILNTESQNEQQIVKFIDVFVPFFINEFHQYNIEHKLPQLISLQKTIIFILLIIYNTKNKSKLIALLTSEDCLIIKTLKQVMVKYKKSKKENFISKLILNLCYDEFKIKMLLGKDKEMEQLYNTIFTELFMSYPEAAPQFSNPPSYAKFISDISQLKLDTGNIIAFNLKGNFPLLHIASESIIMLLLLKDKYTKQKSNEFTFFEFITKIVDKHIMLTKEQYADEHTSLFRKDDFTNIIIKYCFIAFGNLCFIDAFYSPMSKYIDYFESNYINEKEKFETKNFVLFFNDFIAKLKETFPFILKVILKIVDIEVKKNYSIDKDNFSPLLTVAIFNFFINPKVEDIYGIGIAKKKSMRFIIRIMRNICFKTKFDSDDKCSEFNNVIDECNSKLNELIKKEILDQVVIDDKTNEKMCSIDSIGIDIPIFLYENDWIVISTLLSLNHEVIEAYQ